MPEVRPATSENTPPQQTAPPSDTAMSPRFFVQIGAFQQLDGAQALQRKVAADLHWLSPLLAVFSDAHIHRLQAGPYRTRDEAQGIAEQVRDALKFLPVVVRR
jgi:rare lipoprotein A